MAFQSRGSQADRRKENQLRDTFLIQIDTSLSDSEMLYAEDKRASIKMKCLELSQMFGCRFPDE